MSCSPATGDAGGRSDEFHWLMQQRAKTRVNVLAPPMSARSTEKPEGERSEDSSCCRMRRR